jgi:hypothetical protein
MKFGSIEIPPKKPAGQDSDIDAWKKSRTRKQRQGMPELETPAPADDNRVAEESAVHAEPEGPDEHSEDTDAEMSVGSNPVLEKVAGSKRSETRRRGRGGSKDAGADADVSDTQSAEALAVSDEEAPADSNAEGEPSGGQGEDAKPKSMDEYLETTRGEKLQKLSEKLNGFDKPVSANALYEHRATQLAERIGISADREALANAEAAYFRARKRGHKERRKPEDLDRLKQEYDTALFGWREKLATAAEGLDGKDKMEALIIRKRDTLLRPSNVEKEARMGALDERAKTSLGKIENWATRTPVEILQALNKPVAGFGRGLASAFHKSARGDDAASVARRQELGTKYARAARVIAGAGLATAFVWAAAPVAASTALLTFAIYGARGAAGLAAGLGAGKAAGFAYKRFFGSKKQEEIRSSVHEGGATLDSYRAMLDNYKRNNALERAKQKSMLEVGAAFIGGGAAGLATSPFMHEALYQVGSLPSVQNAHMTLDSSMGTQATELTPDQAKGIEGLMSGSSAHHDAAANVPDSASHAGTAPSIRNAPTLDLKTGEPTLPGAVASLENPLAGAKIHDGEGMGQLFVDLRHSLNAEAAPSATSPSPALAHVLGQNPNTLTHEILAAQDGKSLTMHTGDQLVVDKDQNVWFHAKGGEPHLLYENDPAAPGGFKIHPIEGGHMQADAPRVPAAPEGSQAAYHEPDAIEHVSAVPVEAPGTHAPVDVPIDTSPAGSAEFPYAADTPADTGQFPYRAEGSGPAPLDQFMAEKPAAGAAPETPGAGSPDSNGVVPIDQFNAQHASSAIETFTNTHGVEVSQTAPATYAWKMPGMEGVRAVAYGGDEAAIKSMIMEKLHQAPTAKILVAASERDPVTGTLSYRVDEWKMGDNGHFVQTQGVLNPLTGTRLAPPDPRDFIRTIR